MLKFSGVADLTSCLDRKVQVALDVRATSANQATDGIEMLFALLIAKELHELHATGGAKPL